jgi:hypothetical protein
MRLRLSIPCCWNLQCRNYLRIPEKRLWQTKLEAITVLGLLNSRMKDYFDLMLLSRFYEFDGALLLRAIKATFKRRSTEIEGLPVGLTAEFSSAPGKSAQWKTFLRRSRFEAEPTDLDGVIVAVRNFAGPLLFAAADENNLGTENEGAITVPTVIKT